jgi:predicted dehydrogenase
MSRKISIGIAGISNHGRTILNAIRQSGTLDVKACYDINTEASRAAAAETGTRVASSFEDLITDPAIEAVALVTPNHLHIGQIKQALAIGKHVFVEKPITNTVAEAVEIRQFASAKTQTVMVGHNTRRRYVFRAAKKILAEGKLGTIVAVEANISRSVGLTEEIPPWKADPEKCPLLPMMQLGIHFVDAVRYLFSPVRSVYCVASTIAMPGRVLDVSASILRTSEGFPISLSSHYITPDTFYFRIYGTQGILHCDPLSYELKTLVDGVLTISEIERFPNEGIESYILEMKEFGECVLTGSRPETGIDEGIHALAVIEAMMQSVRTNAAVELAAV